MITLVCRRELRVQSRRPNGQFGFGSGGSGGGGGGTPPTSKPSPKKGKVQSKPAPKSVLKGHGSKGEYIESKKTGGIYKNPKWDGQNPGSVAKQGTSDLIFHSPSLPLGKSPSLPLGKSTGGRAPKVAPASAAKHGLNKETTVGDENEVKKINSKFEEQSKKDVTEFHNKEINAGQTELKFSEKDVVTSYTGSKSYQANLLLRSGNGKIDTTSKNGAVVSAYVGKLDPALSSRTLGTDVAVSRVVLIKTEKLKVGDEIYDPAFSSFSTARWSAIGNRTVIETVLPKGTKGMSVRKVSLHRNEDEVLLPAGFTAKVTSITKVVSSSGISNTSATKITVELVSQGIRAGVKNLPIRSIYANGHLIGVGRELRVQSRRPNGQFGFGSGGGGGGGTPSPKKGNIQAKPAPKSVTKGHGSKGEYIESKKTGGIYKNPAWDGKDAGTVALQGTTKLSPVGKFPKAGGSQKTSPAAKKPTSKVQAKPAKTKADMDDEDAQSPFGKMDDSHAESKKRNPDKVDSINGSQSAVDKVTKVQKEQDAKSSFNLHEEINGPSPKPFTLSHEDAIDGYTSTDYSPMNSSLRKRSGAPGYYTESDYQQHFAPMVKATDGALEGRTLMRPVAVTRGIGGDTKIRKLKVGDEMYDPAFQSFSTRSNAVMEGNTVMQVVLPKGTKGTSIRELSGLKMEDEILLPRGATYKVLAIEKGKFRIAGDKEGSVKPVKPTQYMETQVYKTRVTVELVSQGVREGKKMSGIRHLIGVRRATSGRK